MTDGFIVLLRKQFNDLNLDPVFRIDDSETDPGNYREFAVFAVIISAATTAFTSHLRVLSICYYLISSINM